MAERRLQQVHDAFDVNNFKQVLKLCDTALKKGDDAPTFQALKAMALLRTGKAAEARALALEARRAGISAPIDDSLVHSLTLFYRAVGDLGAVVEVCDEAFKAEPSNEVAGTQLFYATVRVFDFAKQQQVAMRLQRQFPAKQREYCMWAVASLLLQAQLGASSADADPSLPPKLLQLANLMVDKAGGPKTVPELRLAIAIADAQAAVAASLSARASRGADASAACAASSAADVASAQRVLELLRTCPQLLGALGTQRAELEAACLARAGERAASLGVRQAALLAEDASENWLALRLYLAELLPTHAPLEGEEAVERRVSAALGGAGAGLLESGHRAATNTVRPAPALSDAAAVATAAATALSTLERLAVTQPRARSSALGRVDVRWRLLAIARSACAPECQRCPSELATDQSSQSGQSSALTDSSHSVSVSASECTADCRAREAALQDELLSFYAAYGDRPCCHEDTRPYLAHISMAAGARELFLARAEALRLGSGASQGADASTADDARASIALQRRVTLLQWRAALGLGSCAASGPAASPGALRAQQLDKSRALAREYGAGVHLAPGRLATELHPADSLLLAASSLLEGDACPLEALARLLLPPRRRLPLGASAGDAAVDGERSRLAATETEAAEASALVASALLLEEGLARSGAHFELRLRLIVTYARLGAAEAAREHFGALSVRKLQLESLQYLLLPCVLGCGLLGQAEAMCAQTLAWYPEAVREVSDTSVLAYKHANYVQAVGFCELRQRLERSRWRLRVAVGSALLRLSAGAGDVQGASALLEGLGLAKRVRACADASGRGGVAAFAASLCCNADRLALPSWAPQRQERGLERAEVWWVRAHVSFLVALELVLCSGALSDSVSVGGSVTDSGSGPAAAEAGPGAEAEAEAATEAAAVARAVAEAEAEAEAETGVDSSMAAAAAPGPAGLVAAPGPAGLVAAPGPAGPMAHPEVGLSALSLALPVLRLARAVRKQTQAQQTQTQQAQTQQTQRAESEAGAVQASAADETPAGAEAIARLLSAAVLRWADRAEAACALALAELQPQPTAAPGDAAASPRAEPAPAPLAPAARWSARTTAACAELSLLQLPASCLLLHAYAHALSRAAPKGSKKGGLGGGESPAQQLQQLCASARGAIREAALRAAIAAELLGRALAEHASVSLAEQESGRGTEAGTPLPLAVLAQADYLLEGTPGAQGAQVAREAMAKRLRASFCDSASQLSKRLLELAALLRTVR